MNQLGELKHEISYNDFGDGAIKVWYNNLYQVKSIAFFEPAFGDVEDAVVEMLKKELDQKLFEMYKLLRTVFEGGK